ncbi:glycosyltransferase, partial [PVC group bacterium]|nr:glycosyltransferase [PVC group bacterium]
MISVIIPVLNEEKILSKNIEYFKKLARHTQLIFVDGGSLDNTIRTIQGVGCCLISPAGRAIQMNKGADYVEHEILLFLHADSFLDIRAISMLEVEMKNNPKLVGGCFTQV